MTRGWIGVQIQPVTPDIADSLGLKNAEGALVAEPQTDGPAVEGRHPVRRRDHHGERPAGAGCARSRQARSAACRPARASSSAIIRKGAREDRQRDARRTAERSARRAPTRECRSATAAATSPRLGLSLAPAGKVAAQREGVVVTEVDPIRPGRRFTASSTGDVILEVARQDGRDAGGGAQGVRATPAPSGKRSVLLRVKSEREHAVRRDSARPRLSSDNPRPELGATARGEFGAVSPAFVAPAGGANPGDGLSPSPPDTVFVHRHPSPPPGARMVEGRRSDPPPLALFWGGCGVQTGARFR